MTDEVGRMEQIRSNAADWRKWGTYLAERQWGTVREDYSENGDAWNYFPFEQSHRRAYRWGEDGLGGFSDRAQHICFALSAWNGRDPILKERLFGLTNFQGNHGEDVKEYYFYLDATPSYSYAKFLYKYPQGPFPYDLLIEENHRRTRHDPEFELLDTGIFRENRYFDIFVEYAKAGPEDICIRINAFNRGPDAADLHMLPTIWFRNTWSWGRDNRKPRLDIEEAGQPLVIGISHPLAGQYSLVVGTGDEPEILFTENETNAEALFGSPNPSSYTKDAFHRYLIAADRGAVNPAQTGTKAAAHFAARLPAGGGSEWRLRLVGAATPSPRNASLSGDFDQVFGARIREADEFYSKSCARQRVSADALRVQRQAFAGLLWNKQSYHYNVPIWLEGDPSQPRPPAQRRTGRNSRWIHLNNADVISMPDTWEYPWYASWDLAFHCVSMALIDPEFAKNQLILLLREWYMQPSGQVPAFEWSFDNANPPVHAWAALRVYKIEARMTGRADREFLEKVFHKLLLNFTWWVNRKDLDGRNVFEGGFMGMDNIGVFDRSQRLAGGGHIEQSDATSWMAMYCLNMLVMALELAHQDPAYEDVASKFFEHFVYISDTMNDIGGAGNGLWDAEDGFYYDFLLAENGARIPLKVRSMVGLIPLLAVETLEPEDVHSLPGFMGRMHWFLEHYPGVRDRVDQSQKTDKGTRYLLSIATRKQLERVLRYALDEKEFLSPFGIRSLSKFHEKNPYTLRIDGQTHTVDYEPAESSTNLFGGNSNWRGPVWFPMNYLLIEALQRYDFYYHDQLKVECPTGSGRLETLWDVAGEMSHRLSALFIRRDGRRPALGDTQVFQNDPYWKDCLLFHEYFNGDNGAGLGAIHQTGWTALVAKLIEQNGE
jgi:hypothetical protein